MRIQFTIIKGQMYNLYLCIYIQEYVFILCLRQNLERHKNMEKKNLISKNQKLNKRINLCKILIIVMKMNGIVDEFTFICERFNYRYFNLLIYNF